MKNKIVEELEEAVNDICGKFMDEVGVTKGDAYPEQELKLAGCYEEIADTLIEIIYQNKDHYKYKCLICGEVIEANEEDIEEDLWGHLQMRHEGIYDECQNLESPDMIGEYYEEINEPVKHQENEIEKLKKEYGEMIFNMALTQIFERGREEASKITEEDIENCDGNGLMTKQFVQDFLKATRELSKYSIMDILQQVKM